ncbi:hypothetical protein BZA05DRAFT_441901 [Tricharina praecox]|uniref:uncharacterized protein n=1 Tax=Tricharina praecox TaxID=43433 RepID=UPI00221FAB23|nr:uncharacterized protein BZA05DRAFT_441901 [Tricharina praecox]KAI5857270.1 hypothetical protein BZA05DRAFT_441901 [Tricharina praecox]
MAMVLVGFSVRGADCYGVPASAALERRQATTTSSTSFTTTTTSVRSTVTVSARTTIPSTAPTASGTMRAIPSIADTKCERFWQNTAIHNNSLYADGGSFSELEGYIKGPSNLTMVLDLTREFSTEAPPYTTISKPDKSTFSMGMLFSWKDTLYQFQGFAHVFEYTQPLYGASREWWNNYGSKRRTGQTFRLWSLDSGKEWVAGQLFTETEPQRAGIGASAVMERRGMGYYLGGAIVNADGKYEQSLYELMTVWDVRNSKWEAVRGPDQPKVGRVNGVLVAMEEFGSSGMLLAMGGVRASSSNVSVDQEGLDFRMVQLYDVATKTWMSQETSGLDSMPDPRLDFCAVVATAPDRSSAQIYVWGGLNYEDNLDAPIDMYILTLPFFRWIKVPFSEVPRGSKSGHRCQTYNSRQMLIVGGQQGRFATGAASIGPAEYIVPGTSDDVPIEGTNCVKGGMGIQIFDTTTLEFVNTFDPTVNTYEIPETVYKLIGGDKSGNATATSPQVGWTDESLGTAFNLAPVNLPDATTSTTPGANTTTESKSNTGAIAGGVVGGLAAVAIAAGIFFWLRRRKSQHSPPPQSAPTYETAMPQNVEYNKMPDHLAEAPAYTMKPPGPVEAGGRPVTASTELPAEQYPPAELWGDEPRRSELAR